MSKAWITRDRQQNVIAGTHAKPKTKDASFFSSDGKPAFLFLNVTEFKKAFGFTPRKGSCKQYELSLKEI
jgi:hypothetical protein